MNENRSIFSIDGITGMLIATGLLIAILVGLSIWAINVQNTTATNFYDLKDAGSIKMIGSKTSDHIVDAK